MEEPEDIKKIGIPIDNYKEETFKRELEKRNIDFEIAPYNDNCKILTVHMMNKDIADFGEIVKSINHLAQSEKR